MDREGPRSSGEGRSVMVRKVAASNLASNLPATGKLTVNLAVN